MALVTRRQRARGRRNRRAVLNRIRFDPDRVETIQGSFFGPHTAVVSASAQLALAINPDNIALFGSRCQDAGDNFRLFRFTEIKLHFCQADQADVAVGSSVVVGYENLPLGAPTTLAQVSESSRVACTMDGQTTRTTLVLSQADLRGIAPWYATSGAATEPLLDTQGQIFISVADSTTGLARAANVNVFTEWTVQFRGPIAPAVSLEAKLHHLAEDERAIVTGVVESWADLEEPDGDRESETARAPEGHAKSSGGVPRPPRPTPVRGFHPRH